MPVKDRRRTSFDMATARPFQQDMNSDKERDGAVGEGPDCAPRLCPLSAF